MEKIDNNDTLGSQQKKEGTEGHNSMSFADQDSEARSHQQFENDTNRSQERIKVEEGEKNHNNC